MEQLRDFVYLDTVRLNSLLASLGQGLPEEIVTQSETDAEFNGEIGAEIPLTSVGVGVEGSHVSSSSVETRLAITAPYRFQQLLHKIEEHDGIEINEKAVPSDLERGDVVQFTGQLYPMSLLQIELAMRAFSDVFNAETLAQLQELQGPGQQLGQGPGADDLDKLEKIRELVQKFTGRKLPLSLSAGVHTVAVPLDRTFLRQTPARAFREAREYTVFGRAEEVIDRGDSWDPISATSVLDRYVPEDNPGQAMREGLLSAGEGMNMDLSEDEMMVNGPAVRVQPVAVYW